MKKSVTYTMALLLAFCLAPCLVFCLAAGAGAETRVDPSLTGLTVQGLSRIDEESSSQYTATASWSDGSTSDVSAEASWSDNSPYAYVSQTGLLTAFSVDKVRSVAVTATYSAGDKTLDDYFTVSVLNVNPEGESDSYTGWWWQGDTRTGTGISIEQQGGRLYMAWYVYDQAGRPVWYSSVLDGRFSIYLGELYTMTGWPLEADQPGDGYTPSAVGTVRIEFATFGEATLTYNDGTEKVVTINRFLTGEHDSRDIQGWWWDESRPGMGVFLESRGEQLFAAWYNYRDDGSPRWWISIGAFGNTDTLYTGQMAQYTGGQTLTGAWQAPQLDSSAGDVSLSFQDSAATLTWQGTSYALTRFVFGDASNADQRIIPDTGILYCHDEDYKISPLPGEYLYGQDPQYNPPERQPSYTDNGDGTVTDNVSGLMWMQADDNTPYTWTDAPNACSDLELGGYDDWRMPDRHELVGLLILKEEFDYAKVPAIDDDVFSTHAEYWASDSVAGAPQTAWTVYYDDCGGGVHQLDTEDTAYVRCVRGKAPQRGNFIAEGDMVLDSTTGLMWMREDDGSSKTWSEALPYCENLELGGLDDWRLPDVKELEDLLDLSLDTEMINSVMGATDRYYWSSSPYTGYTDTWWVHFGDGTLGHHPMDRRCQARCVRGGP